MRRFDVGFSGEVGYRARDFKHTADASSREAQFASHSGQVIARFMRQPKVALDDFLGEFRVAGKPERSPPLLLQGSGPANALLYDGAALRVAGKRQKFLGKKARH